MSHVTQVVCDRCGGMSVSKAGYRSIRVSHYRAATDVAIHTWDMCPVCYEETFRMTPKPAIEPCSGKDDCA